MTHPIEEMSRREASARTKYWGKYRGKVLNNVDPLAMGRLLVETPQVPAGATNWAMPCVPYAGFQVGFFAMPEIDANVWVEFEGGNPNYPIWTGCFWAEGQAPLPYAEDPLQKVFKTRSNTLLLDDTPEAGGVTLKSEPPAVDDEIRLVFSSEGALISAPPAMLNMSIEEGITLEFPPCVLSMSEEEFSSAIADTTIVMTEAATEVTSPDVSVTAEAAIELNALAGAIELGAGAAIELGAGAGIAMEAGAGIDLTAGAGIAQEAAGGIDLTATLGIAMEAATMALETAAMDVTAPIALWAGDLNVVGIITMDTMPVMVVPV